MNTDQAKVLDQIRKLHAKATGTDNAAEADTFLAKVQQLLDRHNVSMYDVHMSDEADPIGVDHAAGKSFKADSWTDILAGQLAAFYNCDLVISTIRNHIYYTVAGRESARLTWSLMYPYVVKQVRQQAKAMVAKHMEANPRLYEFTPAQIPNLTLRKRLRDAQLTKSKAERKVGYAMALRLHGLVRDRELNLDARTKNALVPVDTLEALLREAFPDLKDNSSDSRVLRVDAESRKAAEEINLNSQMAAAPGTTQIGKA